MKLGADDTLKRSIAAKPSALLAWRALLVRYAAMHAPCDDNVQNTCTSFVPGRIDIWGSCASHSRSDPRSLRVAKPSVDERNATIRCGHPAASQYSRDVYATCS